MIQAFNSSSSTSPRIDSLIRGKSQYPYSIGSPPSDPPLTNIIDPALIRYSRTTPTVDVFGSPTVVDSPRNKFLFTPPSKRSPLSSIENLRTMPPPFRSPPSTPLFCTTPVKVEEDVLVMDGILVNSPSPSPLLSNANRTSRLSPLLDSSSPGPGGGSIITNLNYRTEICRFWVENGTCRYGSKCQFAHGKEDLRPTRYSSKRKPEGLVGKTSTAGGSYTYGTTCHVMHNAAAANQTALGQKVEQQSGIVDWSPTDDGIVFCLPSSLTDKSTAREAVDACINDILFGPGRKQRLPIFKEICPE